MPHFETELGRDIHTYPFDHSDWVLPIIGNISTYQHVQLLSSSPVALRNSNPPRWSTVFSAKDCEEYLLRQGLRAAVYLRRLEPWFLAGTLEKGISNTTTSTSLIISIWNVILVFIILWQRSVRNRFWRAHTMQYPIHHIITYYYIGLEGGSLTCVCLSSLCTTVGVPLSIQYIVVASCASSSCSLCLRLWNKLSNMQEMKTTHCLFLSLCPHFMERKKGTGFVGKEEMPVARYILYTQIYISPICTITLGNPSSKPVFP